MDTKSYASWLEWEKKYNNELMKGLLLKRFDCDQDGQLSLNETMKMLKTLAGPTRIFSGEDAVPAQEQTFETIVKGSDQTAVTIRMTPKSLEIKGPCITASRGYQFLNESSSGVFHTDVSLQIINIPNPAIPADEARKSFDDLYNRFGYEPGKGFPGNKRQEMLEYLLDHYPQTGALMGNQTLEINSRGLGL